MFITVLKDLLMSSVIGLKVFTIIIIAFVSILIAIIIWKKRNNIK